MAQVIARLAAAGAPAALEVVGLRKRFVADGQVVPVLDGVDLRVGRGEFVCLLGPSGSGKSTLFNIVAGLDEPDSGEIRLHGVPAGPRLGRVGYMPQRDLLLPWRRLLDNVIIGLEVTGVPRREARERALALFPAFGLSGFEHAYPHTLSGGMRQRAALLRTVLPDRELLLLDEPFGALDALTRATMQEWLLGIWSELRRSILFITHDVEEAALLADRVYVLSARPARVKLEAVVELPRPRSAESVTHPAFVRLKAQLLAAIHDERLRAAEEEIAWQRRR